MDPSDKKRAQPPNSDSVTTPPSKRRQPSSDETRTDQQSAAASAYPTGPTGAPAVADSVSAGHSVSAASRLSPAERCPLDPLSVALSFLGSRDFAAASHVCRHWQRTAELQSAWPEFSVERLISGLIEDENRWTQSRSLRMEADHLSDGVLERAAQSRKWRRLVGLHLYSFAQTDELFPLGPVAQLPQLQSLRLERVRLSDAAAPFSSLAPRLLALRCDYLQNAAVVQSHLHLLVNLRVLSLNQVGEIDGQALLPLHQLEFLQLRCFHFDRELLLAIRRLSVQHRLRHASLQTMVSLALDLTVLTSELSDADSGLAPAALVTFHLDGNLSDASRSALLSLPSLTRLDWKCDATVSQSSAPSQSSLPPSPLQRLRLDFKSDERGAVHLLQLAAVRAPQLRNLHMGNLPPSFDQLVRPLRSLHLLDIALPASASLSQRLLQSLALLPLFTQLVVRQSTWQPQPFELAVETLRCIADSRSWRLIRLIGHNRCPLFPLPDDADARLAERLADFRIQSEWSGCTTSQRLIIGADGSVAWQQMAI